MKKEIIVSAIVAFLIYGGWAFWVNDENYIISSLAQGLASAITTVIIALYLEKINEKINNLGLLIFFVGLLMAGLVFLQFMANYLAQTEKIFYTMLPGMIIGGIYIVGYIVHLRKSNH